MIQSLSDTALLLSRSVELTLLAKATIGTQESASAEVP